MEMVSLLPPKTVSLRARRDDERGNPEGYGTFLTLVGYVDVTDREITGSFGIATSLRSSR